MNNANKVTKLTIKTGSKNNMVLLIHQNRVRLIIRSCGIQKYEMTLENYKRPICLQTSENK